MLATNYDEDNQCYCCQFNSDGYDYDDCDDNVDGDDEHGDEDICGL